MIIGITGRIASGKGVIVEYFIKRGFIHFTYSEAIKEELIENKIEINRKNLQDYANKLRKEQGPDYWTIRLLEKMDINNDFILDGIRNPGEIKKLKEQKDHVFILLSIDAQRDLRFKRFLDRNKSSDPKTWKEFLATDDRDFGENDPFGQQVGLCMEQADYHLINDGSITDFEKKLDKLYKDELDI